MQEKQLLFFDIEIFAHDALVIFKNVDKNVVRAWHNSFEGLREFITGKVIIGFNNHYYDDKILTGMMKGWSPVQLKIMNDDIIVRKRTGQAVDPVIVSLDCFQQIDPQMPGLKKIEGNMGKSIIETPVPFDLARPLTNKEFDTVFDY